MSISLLPLPIQYNTAARAAIGRFHPRVFIADKTQRLVRLLRGASLVLALSSW